MTNPRLTARQKYDAVNDARLAELAARKKERWAKNPVSAFFSDTFGEGAEEHEEAMTRTFDDFALSDEDSMDVLREKTGYKKREQKKTQYPWDKWNGGSNS